MKPKTTVSGPAREAEAVISLAGFGTGPGKVAPVYIKGNFEVMARTLPIVNPATGKVVACMSVVERSLVAEAINAAHEAFQSWRRLTADQRGGYLRTIALGLEERAEEMARMITVENGKPLEQSKAEVALSVEHLRWFAEEGRRAYGRIIPNQAAHKRNLVVKTPVGVVGAISPWNFPLMLAVRKIAPALAAGCTIILKPASATPLCSVLFAEICHAQNLPAGVFQLVAGNAAAIAREFLENPRIRKITFTGSTEVGRSLIAGAAQGVKRLGLELGGLAPVLVFDDADLEVAVNGTMAAKFRNTGQSCIAANRIYVQRGIYPKFVKALVKRCRALKTGDGLEPGVQVGPLINQAAQDDAGAFVADALKHGAELLCGGEKLAQPGFFFAPTVLGNVPPASRCMRQEIFAPIAAVASFDTEAQGLEMANNSGYGLSAYAFTRDLARAFRLMEGLEAGVIGINDGVPTTSIAPFGGVKGKRLGPRIGQRGFGCLPGHKTCVHRLGRPMIRIL